MHIKNILVPMSAEDSNTSALETASMIARLFDGHIEGLHVPRPPVQYQYTNMGSVAATELLSRARESAEQADAEVRRRFDAVVAKRGLQVCDDPSDAKGPSASWHEMEGDEKRALAERGIIFDLVIVNRPNQGSASEGLATLEAVLFGTRRAVLVAPPEFSEDMAGLAAGGWKILVGWNRTAQSGLAVGNAAPFLARSEVVEVFSITTGAKAAGPGPDEAARYAGWHGATAKVKEVASDSRSTGAQLLAEAEEFGAHLLVMGAYSHSRLRELIWGGVTRYVLNNAGLPVLMSH